MGFLCLTTNLKLPYKKCSDARSFSVYIILPDEVDGLPSLLEKLKLHANMFDEELKLVSTKLHGVAIPKFKFSYATQVSNVMEELGLTLAFKAGAELNGMVSACPQHFRRDFVGSVQHREESSSRTIIFTGVVLCPTLAVHKSPKLEVEANPCSSLED
ncbi:hypothetical protein Droror1_Dr00009933 [Drosera rotundifolia]